MWVSALLMETSPPSTRVDAMTAMHQRKILDLLGLVNTEINDLVWKRKQKDLKNKNCDRLDLLIYLIFDNVSASVTTNLHTDQEKVVDPGSLAPSRILGWQ